MTDQEMERYLVSRARALPVPPPRFSRLRECILQQEEARGRRRRSPVKRLVIVCAIMAALVITAAAGFAAYEFSNYGAWDTPSFATAARLEYGVSLPTELGGCTHRSTSCLLVAPHRAASLPEARWEQIYHWYSLLYGDSECGFSVSLGSTANPYWAYCFSYDPDTLEWIPGDNDEYTYLNQSTLKYGGQTLYLHDFWADGRFICHYVTWVDAGQSVCWQVSGGSTAEALSAAKELIDANR